MVVVLTPVPDRATVWIASPSPSILSVIVIVALRAPLAVGENFTLMVQEALTAKVAGLTGQLFVCVKSLGFVPVMTMLLMASGATPLSVIVTICAVLAVPLFWLPKFITVGLTCAPELGVTAVPLNVTLCGLAGPLSVIATLATRASAPLLLWGVNVTLMVQLAFDARLLVQVLVCAKSLAFVPVSAMLLMARVVAPLLVSVVVCAVLVLPMF